jgi:hypothetical protein
MLVAGLGATHIIVGSNVAIIVVREYVAKGPERNLLATPGKISTNLKRNKIFIFQEAL